MVHATSPAFTFHLCGAPRSSNTFSRSTQLRKTQFSHIPPRSFSRPSSSYSSVIAWLSRNPLEDSAIIHAAKACGLPVTIATLSSDAAPPLILSNTSVAVGALGSVRPLLYEKKGDTVTKFYGSDEDRSSKEKRLHPRKEVDERSTWDKVIARIVRVYLPRGFPHTTTPDYISFTKYRTLQNLASAIMSVISTEALLFGLGLGKKVAAGAAAANWVLKDGASYIAKILYGSVFGSKFDDDPKSWRIAADIVEDVGGAIEIMTPLFPMAYFLPLASFAVCLKGMSLMTGTATRHVVYRSLAASGMQNTGDIATKGESQGVTMKMLGLGLGIIVSSKIGQNYYALLGAYGLLACVHIAANWKSVQCVQFSFFNKQRASILIDRHLDRLPLPTPHDVSSIEKIVLPPWKGFQPSVKIGAGVAESVLCSEDLNDARKLFRKERFMIFAKDKGSTLKVLLRENATPTDALRAYYTAKKFMKSNKRTREALQESLTFMRRNISSFEQQTITAGWDTRHMLLADDTVRVKW